MALTNDELQKLAMAKGSLMQSVASGTGATNAYYHPSNQGIAASKLVRSYVSPEMWGSFDAGINRVIYVHTPHAPAKITKTLESFGWQRHINNVGSDSPELFTHKDHEGACLFWYEAMAVQMSLAFVELNK